jgi:hypothetical protein
MWRRVRGLTSAVRFRVGATHHIDRIDGRRPASGMLTVMADGSDGVDRSGATGLMTAIRPPTSRSDVVGPVADPRAGVS